ncbi:MAG: dienelactone hydrolase family protein [Sphingomonadaceae bacterium]|nr:dienelactone hydrolase family protein [Sphingomonadaceae bacterium]MCP5390866.1 dienelactone hydrolase family protein [Sphingomonadaceae bacterium]MCP5394622.1 dienelactone hydrolase family protein [Sphingomonadaceae bacterium]
MSTPHIVDYSADVPMKGRLFMPDADARKPGCILMISEAPGPGENVTSRAARLQERGHGVFLADFHGGGEVLEDHTEIMARLTALREQPDVPLNRGMAALETLQSIPELAGEPVIAAGYCFGGTIALDMGRYGAQLAAIAGFHSGLTPLGGVTSVADWKATGVLACIGADDPTISASERAAFEMEMLDRGGEWTLQVYGGVIHAFTDRNIERIGMPDFARYDRWADEQSWCAFLQLIDHASQVQE